MHGNDGVVSKGYQILKQEEEDDDDINNEEVQ
jgi:hypothetical protein